MKKVFFVGLALEKKFISEIFPESKVVLALGEKISRAVEKEIVSANPLIPNSTLTTKSQSNLQLSTPNPQPNSPATQLQNPTPNLREVDFLAINFGICASKNKGDVSRVFVINKIVTARKNLLPELLFLNQDFYKSHGLDGEKECLESSIETFPHPLGPEDSGKIKSRLADMESEHFFKTASSLLPLENILALKVVSDACSRVDPLDAKEILLKRKQLIKKVIDGFVDFTERESLSREKIVFTKAEEEKIKKIISASHFTFSMKKIFWEKLRLLKALDKEIPFSKLLEIKGRNSKERAKKIISFLNSN